MAIINISKIVPYFYLDILSVKQIQEYMLFSLIAVFGVISSFGYCLVQSNSVVDAISNIYCCSRLPFGIGLAVATGLVIIAGIKSIGKAVSPDIIQASVEAFIDAYNIAYA